MTSLWYGFRTPYRLTIRNSARLFNIVLFNMGDLHLVLPALILSTLNTGIGLTGIGRLMTEHGGLLYVLPLAVHLGFFAGQVML